MTMIDAERLRTLCPQEWDTLYQLGSRRTYRVLYHVTKAESRVLEELDQSVWLAAMEGIETYDVRRGTPLDWVLGIARYKGLSYLRQKYRAKVVVMERLPAVSLAQESLTGSEWIGEKSRILRACIESLPERWQYVLRQKYEIGLSVKDIAELTGTSAKAVESTLSRARHRLRELVDDLVSWEL